jgi:hypothetical protein
MLLRTDFDHGRTRRHLFDESTLNCQTKVRNVLTISTRGHEKPAWYPERGGYLTRYCAVKKLHGRFPLSEKHPRAWAYKPPAEASRGGLARTTPTGSEPWTRSMPRSTPLTIGFIRALTAAGEIKDTNFILSGVSEIGEKKIGSACNWPSTPDETTGSTNPSQKRQ